MKYPVFAIRDFKVGFMSPICEANESVAVRNFKIACARSDSSYFSCPEDFALYHIGFYDAEVGVLEPVVPVREVVTAVQVLQQGGVVDG